MMTQIETLVPEIAQFIEMDADHWSENEGCVQVADYPVFYIKFDDVVELECEGVILETERYVFKLI